MVTSDPFQPSGTSLSPTFSGCGLAEETVNSLVAAVDSTGSLSQSRTGFSGSTEARGTVVGLPRVTGSGVSVPESLESGNGESESASSLLLKERSAGLS